MQQNISLFVAVPPSATHLMCWAMFGVNSSLWPRRELPFPLLH